jgi:hypothetical protein
VTENCLLQAAQVRLYGGGVSPLQHLQHYYMAHAAFGTDYRWEVVVAASKSLSVYALDASFAQI